MVQLGEVARRQGDDLREMIGAPIGADFIPIDGRNHHMREAELADRLGQTFGLMRIEQIGLTSRHIAERAGLGVQTEPKIMNVACFFFQHSPILGHAASSQTVTSFRSRTSSRVSLYSRLTGALTRIQSGFGGDALSGRWIFSGWRGFMAVYNRPYFYICTARP